MAHVLLHALLRVLLRGQVVPTGVRVIVACGCVTIMYQGP